MLPSPIPLRYLSIARAPLAISALLFLFQVLVTFFLASAVNARSLHRPATTTGLPPEPLRWSAQRRPVAS